MRSRPFACCLAALVVLATCLRGAAQAPPDVAGTWVFAGEPTPNPAMGPRPNFGVEFVVRQDATSITVERTAGAQKNVVIHPLDGSEVESKTAVSHTMYRARLEAGKIVLGVTSTSNTPGPDGKPVVTVSTRRLWREGDALMSEWVIASPMPSTSVSMYRQPPQGPVTPNPPARATVASIGWLVGTWEGKLGSAALEERWTPASGGAMLGVSRTVSGPRMVAFEFLRIIERDGGLVYLAQPNGRAPATEFTLTRISPTQAVFENPTHDFPKMITYSLGTDGTLTAVIADVAGLKPQHFTFKKAS